MSRTFDENELLERVDHDWEFLIETVELLSSDGRRLVDEIKAAAAAGDGAALGRAGHALKGMSSNFCCPSAQAAALEVERIGKYGDLSTAPAAVAALEGRLDQLMTALANFVATRAPCE